MIKVYKQLKTNGCSLLLLDSEMPHTKYSKVKIDGVEYEPEIAYGVKNGISVSSTVDFEGKEIIFIN